MDIHALSPLLRLLKESSYFFHFLKAMVIVQPFLSIQVKNNNNNKKTLLKHCISPKNLKRLSGAC